MIELNGTAGNDILLGSEQNDSIDGDGGNDLITGGAGTDVILGGSGNDTIISGEGADTITGGSESDLFAYAEPFAGEDVSANDRQIIGEEDFITDFDFAEDQYFFNNVNFDISGEVNFVAVDANAEDAAIANGTNVISLLNSDNDSNADTPFLAGTAANQIAELVEEDGAGFFVYSNSNLEANRLVYSTNLNDENADLKVIARQTDATGSEAVEALSDFSASNFKFADSASQELTGTTGDDTLIGGVADDTISGDRGDDFLAGDAGNDIIMGDAGNDEIIGGEGSDTITGGSESDIFAYADPFAGEDVSATERQIVGEEDFITDFDFAEDTYSFDPSSFDLTGDVSFTGVDANAEDALIPNGTNVISLLNSDSDSNADTPFLAGTAANQIAELVEEDGAGFFVYSNSNLEANRLVYSTNLNDENADLKVIARQTDATGSEAVEALSGFSASNFEFADSASQELTDTTGEDTTDGSVGDDSTNQELAGTTGDDTLIGGVADDTISGDRGDDFLAGDAGNDIIMGDAGNDEIIGGEGSDTITGGSESDIFAYADPFAGEDVSATERQIVGDEDFITDFNFTEDTYSFDSGSFDLTGDVSFTGVDANAEDALISNGANVVTLLNSDNDSNADTPFVAGTAAGQIAELVEEEGAGFFVYFNSELEVNRLVYSTNLSSADADLKIISRQTDLTGAEAIAALDDFSVNNFEFEAM